MPKGKGYETFEETFGSQDDQPYDSTSSFNMWDMSQKAKPNRFWLPVWRRVAALVLSVHRRRLMPVKNCLADGC